ncbi:MAG: hypothetical protein KKF80_05075, partial [Candidatus Omnitrophica bacterium]|nr:hypothetical protein [Candidatus Omnitrophota bacterium]
VHLLAYGARSYIGNQEHCSIEEAMRAIRETTQCDLLVCAHVNHPIRLDKKLQTALSFADGMEVLNFNYHGMRFPDSRGLYYCARIRRRKNNFFAFSGLDMHTTKKYQAIYCLLPQANRVVRQEIIENFSRGIFVSGSRFCLLRQEPYSAAHLGILYLGNLYVSFARRISRKVKRMVKFLKRSDRICRLYAS